MIIIIIVTIITILLVMLVIFTGLTTLWSRLPWLSNRSIVWLITAPASHKPFQGPMPRQHHLRCLCIRDQSMTLRGSCSGDRKLTFSAGHRGLGGVSVLAVASSSLVWELHRWSFAPMQRSGLRHPAVSFCHCALGMIAGWECRVLLNASSMMQAFVFHA